MAPGVIGGGNRNLKIILAVGGLCQIAICQTSSPAHLPDQQPPSYEVATIKPVSYTHLLDRILDVVGAEAEAAHSAYEGCGAGGGEADEVAFVGARVDDHAGFDSCEGSAFVLGDAELGFDDGVGVESGVDGLEQGFEAFAGEGGERDLGTFTVGSGAGAGGAFTFWTGVCAREQGRALIFWEQVDFVEHFDARLGETFKLAENFFDLRLLFFAVGGRLSLIHI